MSDSRYDKLPVLVLAGFLGSGKTTLLNGLLRLWPRSAALINEFGKTPLDHRFVEERGIPTIAMAGGCLCCQVRGALAPTLKNLWMAWQADKPFDRLIVESSGAATPAPVLEAMLQDRWLARRLSLTGVATTVAAPDAAEYLRRYPEAAAQAICADVLALTQTDLASPEQLAALHDKLTEIAPQTPRLTVTRGNVEPAEWLARFSSPVSRAKLEGEHPEHAFASLTLRLTAPLPWPRLRTALEELLNRRSDILVRVKGVAYFPGDPKPWAVQIAGGRLAPPTALAFMPGEDGIGRLTFIVRGSIDVLAAELLAVLRDGAAQIACERE